MTTLPISVCMISGREAHRIGRALESVAGWTAEILIVLNAEAVDDTEQISSKYGARVFREAWKGYLAQKSSVADKAAQPWILNLDADEVVSAELRQDIERAFAETSSLEKNAAFSFPRLSWFCGRWIRHGDWYPDRQTRLWRRGKGHWGGVDPHPHVVVSGAVTRLRGNLEHYSTESINARLAKLIPFSDEFVAQRASGTQTPRLFELWARPWWRFLRAYFLKLGFLDGWQGYYIARHTEFSTMVRYAKVREARLARRTS